MTRAAQTPRDEAAETLVALGLLHNDKVRAALERGGRGELEATVEYATRWICAMQALLRVLSDLMQHGPAASDPAQAPRQKARTRRAARSGRAAKS